jgi:dCMP deaminase
MIINAGIKKIVFEHGYTDELAQEMIAEAAIEVVRFNGVDGVAV